MSSSTAMPSWFAVYPEFSAQTAQRCADEAKAFRSLVWSLKEQIINVDNMLKRDGAGRWLDEYSQYSQHIWHWLGDFSRVLGLLGGSIEDAMGEAQRAQRVKEQAWADVQRYIRPADFGIDIASVSASTVLRDYVCFRTREYPLQVSYLDSPHHPRIHAHATPPVASPHDAIGADTDAVRLASDAWHDIGWSYRRGLDRFEDATRAWTRECGTFAPANFTSLLKSLKDFPSILDRQSEKLAHTAKCFDDTQEEICKLFGWSVQYLKNITKKIAAEKVQNDEDFIDTLTTQYGLSQESAQTIVDLEYAINKKYSKESQTYRNWLLTRILSSISSDYRGFKWDQAAGALPLTKYAHTVAGSYPYTMTLDEYVTKDLGINQKNWQKLSLEVEIQAKIVNEGTRSKAKDLRELFTVSRDRYNALYTGSNDPDFDTYLNGLIERSYYNDNTARGDFAHLMATTSSHYALPLSKISDVASKGFDGGSEEVVEFSGFMGDAILMTGTKKDPKTGKTYKTPSFGDDDYYSDLDAENIAGRSLANNLSVSQAMSGYYADVAKDSTVREKEFVEHYGGFDNLVGKVYENAIHPDLAAVKSGDYDAISSKNFPPNDKRVLTPGGAWGTQRYTAVYTPVTGTDNRLRDMSKVKELDPAMKYLHKIQEEIQK